MHIYFDLDATLCSIEWCDRLATREWMGKHISQLTKQINEDIGSFDEVFIRMIQLISPSRHDLHELGLHYISSLTPWIWASITKLQQAGHTVGILSQGYRESALEVAKFLTIQERYVHALVFDHRKDGSYEWFPEQALKYENGKTITLRELKKRFPEEKIVFIGDSVRDMIAWQQADLFIGCWFHAINERVKKEAKYFVTTVSELEHYLLS